MSTNGGERFTGEILRTMPLCQIFKACTVSLNSFANLSNLSIMASLGGLAVYRGTGRDSTHVFARFSLLLKYFTLRQNRLAGLVLLNRHRALRLRQG